MAKITIFGLAGTGTSSTGKLLAKRLGYDFVSSGNLFRAKAESLDLTLGEFEQLCNEKPEHDKALDADIAEYGKTHESFVVESRFAWYFIPDSIKIKLTCEDDERLRRVAHRDGLTLAEAISQTKHREEVLMKRCQEYYGIEDYRHDSHFDFIIDTTHIGLEEVIRVIREKINL